jgi:hypothetical protein
MNDLNDAEVQIIFMIRALKLFDKLEIKYSKVGELDWQLTQSHRGKYEIDIKR